MMYAQAEILRCVALPPLVTNCAIHGVLGNGVSLLPLHNFKHRVYFFNHAELSFLLFLTSFPLCPGPFQCQILPRAWCKDLLMLALQKCINFLISKFNNIVLYLDTVFGFLSVGCL